MIYILEDEPIMADCLARAARPHPVQIFADGVTAMAALADGLPDVILLDVLLDGPDGFTFLNELVSYPDTAQIPVIIVSSLDLQGRDLSSYGVVAILDKNTMTPADIKRCIDNVTTNRAVLQCNDDVNTKPTNVLHCNDNVNTNAVQNWQNVSLAEANQGKEGPNGW